MIVNKQITLIPESICNIYDDDNMNFHIENNKICGTLPSCLTASDIEEQDCP